MNISSFPDPRFLILTRRPKWPMVTGQAVVLYSRLHLICKNKRLLQNIKYMIILCALVFHIPTTILTYAARGPAAGGTFQSVHGYEVYEKIQMTGFCAQEFFISGVYLRETIKLMGPSGNKKSKKLMQHLILINVLIIIMDLALLGIEYVDLYTLETTIKGMVYSVKLRLEYAVLGQLVEYSRTPDGTVYTASAHDQEDGTALFRRSTRDSVDSHIARPSMSLTAWSHSQPWRRVSNVSNLTKPDAAGARHMEEVEEDSVDPLEWYPGRCSVSGGTSGEAADAPGVSRDFAFARPNS